MNFSAIIMLVVAIFFGIGCLDRCLGNKFGLGASLENGFGFMGPVALSIVGMICLSPILAGLLQPIIVPLYALLGADAAMFAPTFLSCDSGGYAIASALSDDPQMVRFAGLIVGTMVGPIISFNIPVAIGMIRKEDTKFFATGIMAALIAAPFGCFLGGISSGLSAAKTLINLVPIFILAIVIAVAIFLAADAVIKIFIVFARFMTIVITVGLGIAAFQYLTGITILEGMGDITTGFVTTGVVTLIIAGSFPLAHILEKVLKTPLAALGKRLGMNDAAMSGMLISTVTALPALANYEKMNDRGKIMIAAFAGTAAYLIGPHLGFVSATDKSMILPMFISKCSAGVIALILAGIFEKRVFKEQAAPQTSAKA